MQFIADCLFYSVSQSLSFVTACSRSRFSSQKNIFIPSIAACGAIAVVLSYKLLVGCIFGNFNIIDETGRFASMLVLSRKVGEKILIGDEIVVTVVRVAQGVVRIGIEAPDNLPIVREEIQKNRQSPTVILSENSSIE